MFLAVVCSPLSSSQTGSLLAPSSTSEFTPFSVLWKVVCTSKHAAISSMLTHVSRRFPYLLPALVTSAIGLVGFSITTQLPVEDLDAAQDEA